MNYSAYVHFQVEISHNGTTWKPFGQMRYSNEYYNEWYSYYYISESREWGGLTGDKASYFGFVRPAGFSTNDYAAGVMLLDSTHDYQIRYRYYTGSTYRVDMSYFTLSLIHISEPTRPY